MAGRLVSCYDMGMNPAARAVCQSKKHYDTEFEAEIAAAKSGHAWGCEMITYPCQRHWHIANRDRHNRSRYRTDSQTYCGDCDAYMKRKNYKKHTTRSGHRLRARERDRRLRLSAAEK